MSFDDGRTVENDLYALSQKQLVELARALGHSGIDDATDKPIIIRNILKGVGYRYTTHISKLNVNSRQSIPKPVIYRPKTAELHDLLRNYLADEIALMRAVTSMLETLMQNADMSLNREDTEQVATYATRLIAELGYFHRHSNLARFSSILKQLRPPLSE
jgi:hypothetical protein